jgi:hypothetical protein
MYYGNATATDAGSIANVSWAYDDMETDASKWTYRNTATSGYSVSGGLLQLADGASNYAEMLLTDHHMSLYEHNIIETYTKANTLAASSGVSRGTAILYHPDRANTIDSEGIGQMLYIYSTPPGTGTSRSIYYRSKSGGAWAASTAVTPYTTNTYKLFRAEVHDGVGATFKAYAPNASTPEATLTSTQNPTTPYNNDYHIGIGAYNCTVTCSWISARKSCATPPTVSIGATAMTTPYTYVTPSSTSTQYVTFTTPSYWAENLNVFFRVEEYEQSEYYTPLIAVQTNTQLSLKYDNVDRYSALRVKYNGYHDETYEVDISSITYAYEV